MNIGGDAIYAEPDQLSLNAADPADALESADSSWKEFNLLSLGTFSIFPVRFRHTNHVHQ
jgi:hypothetical protein